jgi:hypothetical protein
MIYDPNPQKALRENVTRQNINTHRKAIESCKATSLTSKMTFAMPEATRDGPANSGSTDTKH